MVGRGGQQRIPRPPVVRSGGPAPWSGLPADARRLSLDTVRARCADLPAPRPPDIVAPGSRPAAVVVPVFEAYGEAHLVLTKRPETMPSHQGEIVFPGGGVRADDATALDAALRETEEEVGIPRSVVEVAAELDSIATFATRFTITPFVGLLDPLPELVPHPREVVEILEVPLSELLADETFREERWSSGDRSIFFFELPGETVWGATARILVTFLSHLARTA